MNHPYFTTAQTPFSFSGFPSKPDGRAPAQPLNGWVNNTSPPPNSNLDHAFGPYDPNIYETNGFVPRKLQHHRQSVQQSPAPSASPPDSLRRNGHDAALPDSSVNPSNNLTGQNVHLDPTGDDFTVRARSSSEERESLTPAQSKRKAQNRAAQRAFRERKERHVKELESKLTDLEHASASLTDENERLKRALAKMTTENEILRVTSSGLPEHPILGARSTISAAGDMLKTGPMKYTPTDLVTAIRINHTDGHDTLRTNFDGAAGAMDQQSSSLSLHPHLDSDNIGPPHISTQGSFIPSAHRTSVSPVTGQRLLSAGATWDYIQAHQLFKDGMVDIADVSQRLKGLAECDGTGPSFEEGKIAQAIEESAAQGRDQLV